MQSPTTPPDSSGQPWLKERVILVTGAGQGLGHAAALTFARRAATVVLLGRTTGKLEKVYDEIVAAGGPLPAIFCMDLEKADEHDFASLALALDTQLGRLDGILHCAAAFESPSPLHQQTTAQWLRQYKVNCLAPFAVNRACLPLLTAAATATVILVGETHGHTPAAYWGGFAVSKAALEAYYRIQAEEWADVANLHVHLVIPGPIDTPQRAQSHPGEAKDRLPSAEALARELADMMAGTETFAGHGLWSFSRNGLDKLHIGS